MGNDVFKLLRVLEAKISDYTSISWSPDGHHLAAATVEGSLEVVNLDGAAVASLEKNWIIPPSFSWSPKGDRLAFCVLTDIGNRIAIWHFPNRKLQEMPITGSEVNAIEWSPDGTFIAAITTTGTLKIINADTGLVNHSQFETDGSFSLAAWSPDGQRLAGVGAYSGMQILERSPHGWKLLKGPAGNGWIDALCWSRSGEVLATVHSDYEAEIRDAYRSLRDKPQRTEEETSRLESYKKQLAQINDARDSL